MKKLFIILLLFSAFAAKAQFGSCLDTNAVIYMLDSNNFDGSQTAYFRLNIDTVDTTNLWMIGGLSKANFPPAHSGINSIQTDTAMPYSVNRSSAFYVWRDTATSALFSNNAPFSISFWHYFNVDTLLDSCIVQMTVDSGATWTGLHFDTENYHPAYNGSLLNTQTNPNLSSRFLFTGKSNGWVQEQICFLSSIALKTTTAVFDHYFGYRFLFKSDGIDSGKPGWVIDDIQMTSPLDYPMTISDPKSNPLLIAPNPSASGIYTLSYPSNYVTGSISVYDVFGRKVYEAALQKTIDLSSLPSGTYLYRAVFTNYKQQYTGHFIRN